MRFLSGLLTGILLVVLSVLAIVASGTVPVAALDDSGPLDGFFAMTVDRAVAHQAAPATNPFANDPQAVALGLQYYRESCLLCHGAPGVEPEDVAEGMSPEPPDLAASDTQKLSDSQLRWIIASGIRMSGMPAYGESLDENDLWRLVAFIRHMPQLSPAEKQALTADSDDEGDDEVVQPSAPSQPRATNR